MNILFRFSLCCVIINSVAAGPDNSRCNELNDPVNGAIEIVTFANILCDHGSMPDGGNVLLCMGTGNRWNDSVPNCVPAADCGNLTISNGQVVTSPDTTYGSTATYTCNEGYYVNGPIERICTRDGSWSESEPVCPPVDCGPLSSILFGTVSYSDTTLANTATYTPEPGYTLTGDTTRTCLPNGTWSGTEPLCIAVECPPLSLVDGSVSPSDVTFGTVVIYTCDEGFEISGDSARTCQADRTWSGQDTTCEAVDCGPLSIIFGTVAYNSDTTLDNNGTYTPEPGYILTGDTTRTCLPNGTWSGSEPLCEPVECPPLSPADGTVSPSDVTFGTVVTYTCDEGFEIDGDSTRICQADGTWSGQNTTCEGVDCHAFCVEYGTVTPLITTFNTNVTTTCDTGFTMTGDVQRTCNADGTWSGDQPTCTIVDCNTPPPVTDGSISTPATTFGSVANYSCDPDKWLNGQSQRECLENGQWSGSAPLCSDCAERPLDLVFVVDGSTNVGRTNFNKMNAFITSLIDDLSIGANAIRVGYVQYGNSVNSEFDLGEFDDKATLKSQIQSISYMTGSTYLHLGINKMRDYQFSSSRSGIPSVAIIFVDGPIDSNIEDTIAAAETVKRCEITIFAIGITANVNDQHVIRIASQPKTENENYFLVDNFNQLRAADYDGSGKSLKELLIAQFCQV